MTYQHLTREERYQIQARHEMGHSCPQIGDLLKRDRCTIYRKIKGNSVNGMYLGEQAQLKANIQQRNSRNARKIEPEAWKLVTKYIGLWLSPDQVAQRLYVERKISISHESIYQYI
jgi:IS30 family transposase